MRLSHILAAIALAWAAVSSVLPAYAHLTPNSEVTLDFGQQAVRADIIIPQGEYAYATGNPADNSRAATDRAKAFLREHVAIRAPDGRDWTMAIESLAFEQIAGPPDLHAVALLTPPPGQSVRRMTIDWRAVIDRVPSHFVLFVARSDFLSGKLEERQILGALQGDRRSLNIDRGNASMTRGFLAAVRLGMHHIAEGADHLLFLIALLLPAPLLAAGGRWNEPRPIRSTLWHLVAIVSAFTVGHSVTLIGSAAFGWQLPAQPVEILIALSILISAIHALRPIFPGRETVVAGGFGLIHGLAFATIIGHFGLGATEKALSILGFNIGIEVVQLVVVVSLLPALLLLARTRFFPAFRIAGGVFAICASLAWLAERVSGAGNVVAGTIDTLFGHAPWLILALTAAALIAHGRWSNRPTRT